MDEWEPALSPRHSAIPSISKLNPYRATKSTPNWNKGLVLHKLSETKAQGALEPAKCWPYGITPD